jgi:hypothetical protein
MPDGEAPVMRRPIPEHDLSADEAALLEDPHGYTFNIIVERSRATGNVDETDHAESPVRKSLDENLESSRANSEKVADESANSENETDQAGRSRTAQGSGYWSI